MAFVLQVVYFVLQFQVQRSRFKVDYFLNALNQQPRTLNVEH